jgi:apolipoprotein N-acyltransferase
MAVMTNDGWWGDTPGYRQHFRFASLRAIEMRRDIVHATNTGTSGFINQRGDILQKTDWWVPVAIKENVHLNSEKTIFVKYGDVIGRVSSFLFCLLMLSLIGISFIYKRKR